MPVLYFYGHENPDMRILIKTEWYLNEQFEYVEIKNNKPWRHACICMDTKSWYLNLDADVDSKFYNDHYNLVSPTLVISSIIMFIYYTILRRNKYTGEK